MRCLLLFVLALPTVVTAQLSTIAPGARVRVTAPSTAKKPVVGTLMAPVGDTVFVAIQHRRATGDNAYTVDRRLVPRSSMERLEISHGRSRWSGAKRGALVGLAGAVALGFVSAVQSSDDGPEGSQIGPAGVAVVFAVVFVPPSALVGALIGAEKWTQIYARPR